MMAAMHIRHELRYAAAPPAVYEMLADPAFRRKVTEAMDAVSSEIAVDRTDTGMSVRIDMVQRTHGVPGVARKVVGEETRIVQAEQWVDGKSAELEVEIPGKPGHIRGRITLSADGTETVESFVGDATVNIPLVGKKLESLIEKLFVDGMDTEQRVGRDWLAGRR